MLLALPGQGSRLSFAPGSRQLSEFSVFAWKRPDRLGAFSEGTIFKNKRGIDQEHSESWFTKYFFLVSGCLGSHEAGSLFWSLAWLCPQLLAVCRHFQQVASGLLQLQAKLQPHFSYFKFLTLSLIFLLTSRSCVFSHPMKTWWALIICQGSQRPSQFHTISHGPGSWTLQHKAGGPEITPSSPQEWSLK